MSRSTPYIIAGLLLAGAVLIWLLPPPVRLHARSTDLARTATPRPTATVVTPVPTVEPTPAN